MAVQILHESTGSSFSPRMVKRRETIITKQISASLLWTIDILAHISASGDLFWGYGAGKHVLVPE